MQQPLACGRLSGHNLWIRWRLVWTQFSIASRQPQHRRVSRHDLEEVRSNKTVLTRLISRVGRAKGVIETLLDDDQDLQVIWDLGY